MEILTNENIIIGIGSITIILFILNLILILKLQSRYKKLLRGKQVNDFETLILSIHKDLDEQKRFRGELETYLSKVEKRLKRSIQGIENINFNAFTGSETGAKSFASAFLNENGDGIIISSLHARDRISVFAKKISQYKSEINLSEEETLALTKAKESCSV